MDPVQHLQVQSMVRMLAAIVAESGSLDALLSVQATLSEVVSEIEALRHIDLLVERQHEEPDWNDCM